MKFSEADVDRWWQDLDRSTRAELLAAWDEGADEWADKISAGAIVLVGEPTDAAEADAADDERAEGELRDYINNHEIVFFLSTRTFHICRAHAAARDVLAAGFLPASFQCPNRDNKCPMQKVLACAGGKSVRLHWPERL